MRAPAWPQDVHALHGQYVSAAKAAAEEAGAAVGAAYDAMVASLEEERQRLGSFTQQQAAAQEAALGATQALVAALHEQLEAAKAQVRLACALRALHARDWTLDQVRSRVCYCSSGPSLALQGWWRPDPTLPAAWVTPVLCCAALPCCLRTASTRGAAQAGAAVAA